MKSTPPSLPLPHEDGVIQFFPHQEVVFDYLNHQGSLRQRTVVPVSLRYGTLPWHPRPCWLLLGWDVERGEVREFSLASATSPVSTGAVDQDLAQTIAEAILHYKARQVAAGGDL